jgi:hypothetical protein
MNKLICSLFVALMILVTLAACATEKPLCPDWATAELGNHCEATSLSITPSDTIGLATWQVGQIQLNDAFINNVYGVKFYAPDGQEVNPKDLQGGIFYSFEKTDSVGGFRIYPTPSHNLLSADTHLLLAKSIK